MEESEISHEASAVSPATLNGAGGDASHSPDDGAAPLAENDLLGFSMPATSSNDDLLEFSTPQETLASSSTDDLLDYFASAPTSMSTSPAETDAVMESKQENTSNNAAHDLLDFGTTPVSAVAEEEEAVAAENASPSVPAAHEATSTTTSTTNDLLDFMSTEPVQQNMPEMEGNQENTQSEAMEQASSQPDAFDVFSSPQPLLNDEETAASEPTDNTPAEETAAAPVHNVAKSRNVFSEEQPGGSTSETGAGTVADGVPQNGNNETLAEETPATDVPTETESRSDDTPVETLNDSKPLQTEAPVPDTASANVPLADNEPTEPESSVMKEATTETDTAPQEISFLLEDVDTNNTTGVKQTVEAGAPESKSPTFEGENANSTAEVHQDVAPPTEDGVDQFASLASNKQNAADQGESIESKSESQQQQQQVIPEEIKDNDPLEQEIKTTDQMALDVNNTIADDIHVEDEEEGMAEVSLDTEPVKPPVVAAPSDHTVLSDTVAKSVQEADPWQMDVPAATNNSSDSKEASIENTESADDPVETNDTLPISEPSPTMVAIPPAGSGQASNDCAEKYALLVELQSSLQDHMSKQAEAEDRARKAEARVKQLEQDLQAKEKAESELEAMKGRMKSVVGDKANLELELAKLRATRDEHERKEVVLSNRLNAAKKKEALKADLAERLEDEVKALQDELNATKEKLAEAEGSGQKTEKTLEETTQQMTERVRIAETALADERRLNEDRKKKMKAFIESKQEEVRQGKLQTDELNAELEQTNRLLREQNSRWKQLHAQWVQSQTRNRELQRDLNRIKKDSDNMHKIGDKMEMKLSKSAQETEEHKNKRLTAKHELMTILRTLEAEREVSSKLRDSLKFTFTPKALSQQQLMKESLRDFDAELQKLSRRLGRPLPPSIDSPAILSDDDEEGDGVITENTNTDAVEEDKDGVLNRSELDSNHLISNLENETQRVSQCIMALTSSIERMHIVLDESGPNTCINALTNILMGNAPPQTNNIEGERTSMTGMRSTRYGQVPQANRDY